jgi:hypothetical protein
MKKIGSQTSFMSTSIDNSMLLGGFFFIRLFPFLFYLANFGVQIAPDSGTYRYGFLDWDILSSHRGFGITLPYTLIPNDFLIVIFQFSMVTFAGMFLIRELGQISGKYKYLAILSVFAVLNSPTVAIWDVWLLSHSLSMSYNIISFTFLIKFSRKRQVKYLYAFGFFIFLSSVSRPNNQVVLILVLTFLIIQLLSSVNWRRIKNAYKSNIALSLYFIVLILISTGVNSNLEKKWSPQLPVAILPYILDARVPISVDLIREAKADLKIPDCAFPSQALVNDNGKYLKTVYEECEAGVVWLENDFRNWYIRFLLTEPKSTLKAISFGTTIGLGYPTNYGEYFPTVVPEPILKLFIGAPKFRDEIGTYPLFGWVLLALFTSLSLLYRRITIGSAKQNSFPKESGALLVAWLTSACIGIIYQSHGDNFRVFIDNQVIIILIASYLIAVNTSSTNELSKLHHDTGGFLAKRKRKSEHFLDPN